MSTETSALAAQARSILACPAAATLALERADGLPGEPLDAGLGPDLPLADEGGTPQFACHPDSPLARAAAAGLAVRLTLAADAGQAETVTLVGRLAPVAVEDCPCCAEPRHVVALEVDSVRLCAAEVPVTDFRARDHELNPGRLRRIAEHTNQGHQRELHQALSTGTGTPPGRLLGAQIAYLTPSEAVVQWVDPTGAHQRVLTFPRPARTLAELTGLLRRSLHAGLC